MFGTKVFILDKNTNKGKLAQRSVEGVFVSYPRDKKEFRVWLPNTKQIVEARDVRFLEEKTNVSHGRLLEDFKIKDLGLAKYCLGLEINQSERQIELSQSDYIFGLLHKYGMEHCNPVVIPAEISARFYEEDEILQPNYPHRENVGALMYLVVATRPDIANAASRLAQFASKSTKCHWRAAKKISCRYCENVFGV